MRVALTILSLAFSLTLATPAAVAEVTVNLLDLRRACMVPRGFALTEIFGVNHTLQQDVILDTRLEQELSGKTPAALAEAYYAFESNPQTRHPFADRYAQCIYGERLRQLDPTADLATVRRGEYVPPNAATATAPANDPWSSALRRSDTGSAGSSVLAQSADPALRAERQRQNVALRQQSEERLAQRRADSEAFWGAVLQAGLVVAETYVEAQAQQAQAEADARAAAAQTQSQWGATPWSTQQQQASNQAPSQQPTTPCAPAGTVYYYGQGNCSGSAGAGGVQGGEPMDPATGGRQPCVRERGLVSTEQRTQAGVFEHYYRATNHCSFRVELRVAASGSSGSQRTMQPGETVSVFVTISRNRSESVMVSVFRS